MTSKEALGKIKKLIFIMGEILVAESKQDISPEEAIQRIRKTCNKYSVNGTDYETIKQDLEMLEILKRHFDFSSPLSMNYFIEFFIYNSDEEFEKVKEWLTNE